MVAAEDRMLIEEIGKIIKQNRRRLGLKQSDLANAMQVSVQAVSKWERGENAPDITIIPKLATLFNISIDRLFGVYEKKNRTIEATVFVSDIVTFTERVKSLSPEDAAIILNSHYYQLTESILRYDGIPVKYIGDEFLCFFSGLNHTKRAIEASLNIRSIISEKISIGLACGSVFFGSIGHPVYSQSDIMGKVVQNAFNMCMWARKKTESGIAIAVKESEFEKLANQIETGNVEEMSIPDGKMKLLEIVGMKLPRSDEKH